MDTSEMLDHIHNVRQAIRYAASDHKGQELPGFSIPKKVQTAPEHNKTNQKTFASREDSALPGQPPSLIRVFTVHFMGSWGPKPSSCGRQRLITVKQIRRVFDDF